MYDEKKITSIVKKVCKEYKVINGFHPHGDRAEGYSFIFTGGVIYSWLINAVIKAINEAFPEEEELSGWRIQNGKCQMPCKGVKKEQEDTCFEIRLLFKHLCIQY